MQRGSFQNLQDLLSPANQGLGLPSDSSDQESEGPDSTKRILLIQNQLPLKCWLKEDGDWDYEWDKDSLFYQSKAALVESNQQVMYVGQLGADIPSDQQDRVSAELMSRFTCAPVFLPTAVKDRFYKGMCKQIMWPLFHYILPLSPQSQARYDPNLWQCLINVRWGRQAYIAANKKFADRVVEVINPDKDFIWAHDYHLLLLPTLLRKRFHTVSFLCLALRAVIRARPLTCCEAL
ncbi:hypothetical protein CYMTET_53337 [Cymbomonas tetramitiformis]|uniref:Trehalose-6-phosphate synthase n=1 Tax=Cymbomonas tetramitiformis TaxID=36881 RepID=A0AAE0EPU3_9CHLO|nr:hypothetical protein CYMTET_53337 [Cymbomonas tetramitiformis]